MKILLTLCISIPWYESIETGEKKSCNKKCYHIKTQGYSNNTVNSTASPFNYK